MSSYTKFFRSSGAICKAFTRSDNNTYDVTSSINLDHPIDVLVLEVLEQFRLVFVHDLLGDQLVSFRLPLVDDHLVILPKLNLIILQRLG